MYRHSAIDVDVGQPIGVGATLFRKWKSSASDHTEVDDRMTWNWFAGQYQSAFGIRRESCDHQRSESSP
jgi:hypothetical protein